MVQCALRILLKDNIAQFEGELFIYDLLECKHKSQYLFASALVGLALYAIRRIATRGSHEMDTRSGTVQGLAVLRPARDPITHDGCCRVS